MVDRLWCFRCRGSWYPRQMKWKWVNGMALCSKCFHKHQQITRRSKFKGCIAKSTMAGKIVAVNPVKESA